MSIHGLQPHEIVAVILIGLGFIFMAIAAFGVIMLPDFYTRVHASGVGETLGALLMILGMITYVGLKIVSLKILIIFFILMFTNPLGTNLIMLEAVHARNYKGYNDYKRAGEAVKAETGDVSGAAEAAGEATKAEAGEAAVKAEEDGEE